jgi:hypothetical protein
MSPAGFQAGGKHVQQLSQLKCDKSNHENHLKANLFFEIWQSLRVPGPLKVCVFIDSHLVGTD